MDARSKSLYQPLPKEVVAVAGRIGLDRATPQVRQEFISGDFLPSHLSDSNQHLAEPKSELHHQVYLLDEMDKTAKTIGRENAKKRGKKRCSPTVRTKRLTSAQRKELFTIEKSDNGLEYEKFLAINSIWQSYIDELLLGNVSGGSGSTSTASSKGLPNAEAKLLQADYHGAKFAVLASNNPDLVGISGLVVQETKNTFKLLNKENKLLTIGKEGTVFALRAGGQICKLIGSNLKMSPFNRSRAKIKSIKANQFSSAIL